AMKHALAPGAQEVALPIEHHHRVLAAVEDVDLVLACNGDGRYVLEGPTVGKLGPVLDHAVAMLAAAQYDRHVNLPSQHIFAPALALISRRMSPGPSHHPL